MLLISTESLEGGMFATATSHSAPFFLYSTLNDWRGKPRLPRGIQVTYADVSDAVEMVGLSGASGAEKQKTGHQADEYNTHTHTHCFPIGHPYMERAHAHNNNTETSRTPTDTYCWLILQWEE